MMNSVETLPNPTSHAAWRGKSLGRPCFNYASTRLTSLPSRNLMAKDDFKNLGFREGSKPASPSTSEPEQGVKGELRW